MKVAQVFALLPLAGALLLLSPSAHAKKQRTRYFELQPMVGYSWINLTGFSESQFRQNFNLEEVDPEDPVGGALSDAEVPVAGSGPSVGAAAQLKLWVFVLGARYAYTHTDDFGLHTVGGDLGLRLGGRVSIYGRLGPGWTMQSGLPAGINTQGLMAEVSGGIEVQLVEAASIGIGMDADLLLLTRTGQLRAAQDAAQNGVNAENLQEIDGSALGFQLRPQIHFTWHI